ncbi:MAG: hypothetical protein CVV34_00330 [Methanomicrobiales archaeon HGW-Methanomicrobiales-5]|nr:MAG: hypothetical protein CVV34_00330 [Methanomicrobiales archaeon HGW-Methanomicrobiales-5]
MTYPLRVPGISGFTEFFIIVLQILMGVFVRVKCTLISIHTDKKGFAGDGERILPTKGSFLCLPKPIIMYIY